MTPRLPVPVGEKFGRLTVIGAADPDKLGRSRWLCRCDCGTEKVMASNVLRTGQNKGCGCLNGRWVKHGYTRDGQWHPLYGIWKQMRQRCRNPRVRCYERYGGRGITVCERWEESFPNFLADVGEKPGPEYTLDRIDNFGNYEPGNVRWATPAEQAKNRRPRSSNLKPKSERSRKKGK